MIFKSPYPNIEIPEIPLTDYIFQHSNEILNKTALIDGSTGRKVNYEELVSLIQQTANGLSERGFQKGDIFAIYSPNIPEYAVIFHAVAMLGGINTMINPLYTTEELAYQLKDSGAKYLITIELFLDKAEAAADLTGIEELFVFGNSPKATPFTSLISKNKNKPLVKIDPVSDIVVLPYSSGTTGLPKGVMLTHYNLVANMCQLEGVQGQTEICEKDTLIGLLPFFHIYGMLVILNYSLSKGACIITMPRFEIEQFLQLMEKYGITIAHLVPPIILQLGKFKDLEKYDLSKLMRIRSGAAPLSSELASLVSKRLNCPVLQGYGLNETSPVTHVCPDISDMHKLSSVGPCVPNTEIKIVDIKSNIELDAGQEGEIWIRGPQVMKGYLNRPDATAHVIDSDGWFHTGDIGYADEDGFLHVVDRLKELIKYKGFQVAPAELEALLISHPSIADAAVIPSPDEEAGELPKAFVVLKEELSPDSIIKFIADRVAPHKKIRLIEIIDQIPRSVSGKILRRVLVEQERNRLNKF